MSDTPFVKGVEKLQRRIATIRQNLALPVLNAEIAGLLLNRTLRRFEQEVDPNNSPWKPLAEATQVTKRRKGVGDRKILQATGELKKSIRIIKGGVGTVATNTGASVRIGVDEPKVLKRAHAAQKGWGKNPMRRFIGLGALDIKAVDSLLRRKAKKIESGEL